MGPKNERESCGISRCSHVSAGRVLVASCGKDMFQYVSSCLISRDRAVWGGRGVNAPPVIATELQNSSVHP